MSEVEDGGPILPFKQHKWVDAGPGTPAGAKRCIDVSHLGLTIRDYFAAAALTGAVARYRDYFDQKNIDLAGELAYALADSLLKARSQTAKGGE